MTIYEIDSRLRELEEQLTSGFNEDTGEITDQELIDKTMEEINSLDMARNDKIEGALLLRQEILEEKASIDNEIKRLTAMKKQRERRAERLKDYVQSNLAGDKFKTNKISVYYRTDYAVNITNADAIPDEFVKVEVKPAKDKIKKAIKAGKSVSGAELEEHRNMIIK